MRLGHRRADDLDHVRVGALLVAHDHRGDGRDIDGRIGERRQRGAHARRGDGRYVALDIDDDLGVAADRGKRFVNPRRAVERDRPGHGCLAAGATDRGGDLGRVGRHHDAADIRLDRPAPDMNDHRLAGDVGKRLAGEARRGHAGGDETMAVTGPDLRVAKRPKARRLYGLPPLRQSLSFPPHLLGPRSGIGAHGLLRIQQARRRGTGHGPRRHGHRHHRGHHLRAGQAGEAGIRDRGRRRRRQEAAGAPAGGGVQPIAMRLAKADVESPAKPRPRPVSAATRSPRAARAKQGPNLYGVVGGPAAHMEGFKYSAGHARPAPEGDQLDVRGTRQVPGGAARLRPRHRHDIRRPEEARPARQCDRLSQRELRFAPAAAAGGRGAGRRRARRSGAAEASRRPADRQPSPRSRNRRPPRLPQPARKPRRRLTPEKAPAEGATPAPAK